jgi:hypothetical protein
MSVVHTVQVQQVKDGHFKIDPGDSEDCFLWSHFVKDRDHAFPIILPVIDNISGLNLHASGIVLDHLTYIWLGLIM